MNGNTELEVEEPTNIGDVPKMMGDQRLGKNVVRRTEGLNTNSVERVTLDPPDREVSTKSWKVDGTSDTSYVVGSLYFGSLTEGR